MENKTFKGIKSKQEAKMNNQIKASFNVDEKLWDDFKIWCIKNKVTMTEKLEELLKEVLEK